MLTEGMFVGDRYEIVNKIGTGGMSDVYKAKDHTLGRFVAIKVLKPEFSEDVNFVTKFRTEAQSAAGLEHPNIVNIYDVGSENGMHYIVMEYVEGITLKTILRKKDSSHSRRLSALQSRWEEVLRLPITKALSTGISSRRTSLSPQREK